MSATRRNAVTNSAPASTAASTSAAHVITEGRAVLGIELGSTRIKACLVGENPNEVLATGSYEWQNQFVDGVWTYSLDAVWAGLEAAYAALVAEATERHGVVPTTFSAIGISAMMHGYLAFDETDDQLVPFRTWRNTSTGEAAAALTELFGVNIPLRWSIAHLHQAVMSGESHVSQVSFITTLAGYVHWKLTGKRVVGIGDASGMFPINAAGTDFNADLLARYDSAVTDTTGSNDVAAGSALVGSIRRMLPAILPAGHPAGILTADGAALLDPTGVLTPGAAFCPPEGDAGTGMVATNAVAPGTGNVSAGTSIFAMVVLERPLQRVHPELDVVATPAGHPVAMVHCNNGASELNAWAGIFGEFATALGAPADDSAVFGTLFRAALDGEDDAGGLLAYNYLSGEHITKLEEGRPLFLRTPDSALSLANFMRAQLFAAFATLRVGMDVLLKEEGVRLDAMFAHGGLFRTKGVAQRFLAGAIGAPVTVGEIAGEGGAWGIAVLAAFMKGRAPEQALGDYLASEVFSGSPLETIDPDLADVAGFDAFMARWTAGLDIERAAVASI